MSDVVEFLLADACFEDDPPVLVDIGASGALPSDWTRLARHSIGVAFDADTRDFDVNDSRRRQWRQLHLLDRLVGVEESAGQEFHLTNSPHCSSALEPDAAALAPWAFSDLFRIEKSVRLPSTTLMAALASIGLRRIDWIKTDTQGTDLRIFRALPSAIQVGVLAADFEPGIIDAYRGEDKLHTLMAYMDGMPFWVSRMTVKGSQWVGRDGADALRAAVRGHPHAFLPTAPGWCEIGYLNRCEGDRFGERDHLLAAVIAIVQGQTGFAHELASRGEARYGNPRFAAVKREVGRSIRRRGWRYVASIIRSAVGRLA